MEIQLISLTFFNLPGSRKQKPYENIKEIELHLSTLE